MDEFLVALTLTLGFVGGAIVFPQMTWGLVKLSVVFAVVLLGLDQVNEFLAGYALDQSSFPVQVFTWVWFYFRLDLLLTFLGPVFALGLVAKFFSRA